MSLAFTHTALVKKGIALHVPTSVQSRTALVLWTEISCLSCEQQQHRGCAFLAVAFSEQLHVTYLSLPMSLGPIRSGGGTGGFWPHPTPWGSCCRALYISAQPHLAMPSTLCPLPDCFPAHTFVHAQGRKFALNVLQHDAVLHV